MSAVGSKRKPSERPAPDTDSEEEGDGSSALAAASQRRRIDGGGSAAGAGAESPRSDDEADDQIEEGSFEQYDDAERAAERVNPEAVKIAADPRMPCAIRRVMMKNIRCHKFMEVTFNDRINFIVGKNGSGKSSILTAIRLALGMPLPGGATGGKKGSGVGGESIIRDGSDEEAIVEVEFSNTGEFGLLDTSVFGGYFMIRRSLTRGESGRVVDKYDVFKDGVEKVKISKSAMIDLLRSKNVFANNPAMIMDQETGKLFFTGSARDQYKFFIEATCLQRNYDAIVRASEEVKSMRAKVVDRQRGLHELQVERKSAEAALNEVQRLALLKSQLTQAQTDVLFAQLSSRKIELERQQKEMNEKWNLTRILEVEDKFKAAVAVQEAKKAQAEKYLAENTSRVAEYEAEVEAKTKVMNDLLRPLTLATKEESTCSKNADAAKRFLKQAERELADFQDHLRSRDVGSQKQLRLERINAAQVDLDEAQAEQQQAQEAAESMADVDAVEDEVERARTDVERAKQGVAKARAALEAARKPISDDPLVRLDDLAKAGNFKARDAIELHRAVTKLQQERQFKTKPVGPLCTQIKCDSFWRNAFESVLAHLKLGYAVAHKEDAKIMETKVYPKKFSYELKPFSDAKYPDSRFKKFPSATRLMDVITIESPWAFNVVADFSDFDRVLLARDYTEGVALAKTPGIKYVLYKDGARETASSTGGTTRAAHNSDGAYDLGVLVRDRSGTSATSQKDRERELQEQLAGCTAFQMECETVLKNVSKRLADCQRTRGSIEKRLQQAQAEVQQFRKRLQAAKNEPEPQDTNEEDAIRLSTLQEKVDSAAEAVHEANAKLEAVKAQRAALMPAVEAARSALNALQKTLAENSSEAAEEDVKEQTRKLETVMNALASARDKVEQMKRDRRAREESLAADMEKWNADLLDVKARTGVDKPSVSDISLVAAQATCNAAEKALAKESARLQRSPEAVAEIKARFEAADLVYRNEAAQVHLMEEDFERLKAELTAHSKKFATSRHEMCQAVSADFVNFMANKGYGAKLIFKHDPETKDQGELEILVTPDKSTRFGGASQMGHTQADAENAPLQHVGTLSGGEKSASTLILLAAIAFNSPVPFRMIDEFDVFQDEVSRKFSLKLLISQGEQANLTGRYAQFILLTPHDISSVQPTAAQKDLIKVLKLKDPLRT